MKTLTIAKFKRKVIAVEIISKPQMYSDITNLYLFLYENYGRKLITDI